VTDFIMKAVYEEQGRCAAEHAGGLCLLTAGHEGQHFVVLVHMTWLPAVRISDGLVRVEAMP
jgi:hypothetical protein